MARIVWDNAGERYYNAGLDRGVLYVDGKAVPWNGLISVEERSVGGEIVPVYLDGIRIRNLPNLSEYEATLTAFYSPPEFDQCDGILQAQYLGFFATNQTRKSFGLSYRTGFTNDVGGEGAKIHLIYNAMAEPSSKTYETISDDPSASHLQWDIKTAPNMEVGGFISSHYIFDTTKVEDYIVDAIEDLLYGTKTSSGRLPTSSDIQQVFVNEWGLVVTQIGTGKYEISGSDNAVKLVNGSYAISGPTVVKKAQSYDISTGGGAR